MLSWHDESRQKGQQIAGKGPITAGLGEAVAVCRTSPALCGAGGGELLRVAESMARLVWRNGGLQRGVIFRGVGRDLAQFLSDQELADMACLCMEHNTFQQR